MNQIHHMYWGMGVKEQIEEANARAYLAVIQERNTHKNRNRFVELRDELMEVDPEWETWWDDDKNIPQYISWSHCQNVLFALQERIAFVKGISHD